MKAKEGKRTKKKKWKNNLLTILGIIAVYCMINLCITLIFAGQIPHRFASKEEGQELMLANTAYFNQLTQNDIEFRVRKTGATMEDMLETSKESVKDFSFIEKWYLNSRIARMALHFKLRGCHIPEIDEIVYIKADMDMESGATGYTHGTEIYLSDITLTTYAYLNFIPGFGEFMDHTLYHELFHCLTRCNSDFREQMYALIHFTVADTDFEMPPSVLEKYISNPDVEHHDSYATFMIDGEPIDCFLVYITAKTYAEAQAGFMHNDGIALVPIDGTDAYYTPEQASNFDEVLGTNTSYRIDPEECMADNFADAMQYGIKGNKGEGYPNPEIIQGVIDYLKQKR